MTCPTKLDSHLKFSKKGIDMSTDFYVTLTASDDSTTQVKIMYAFIRLPLPDSFESDEAALGNKGGKAVFGTDGVVLHTGPGGAGNVTLDGFSQDTKKDSTGTGSKISDLGTFPDGDLKWSCDRVD